MDMTAMRTSPSFDAAIEGGKQGWQVVHDAFQLHLDAMHEAIAVRAVPFEAILHALRALPLDDQTA
jgi:hypothetical protein